MNESSHIPGYQLGEEVERIGCRKIYTALELARGKEVFLSLYSSVGPSDIRYLSFRAKQFKKLHHPHLVSILDFGILPQKTTSGQQIFYYTFPLVASLPLTGYMSRIHNSEERIYTWIFYLLQALRSLQYIHQAQVTHRDISPQCFRVNTSSRDLIIEGFIHSRPRQESPESLYHVHFPYLSPEQLLGGTASSASDIYSLGATFYELLAGKPLYTSNYLKVEEAKNGVIPSLSQEVPYLPKRFCHTITRATSPQNLRYKHAGEWIQELEGIYSQRALKYKWRDFVSQCKKAFALFSPSVS